YIVDPKCLVSAKPCDIPETRPYNSLHINSRTLDVSFKLTSLFQLLTLTLK
ncbi:hypothetical protein ISN44_As11g006760, partial [Arabidopsis suecica]